MTQRNLIILRGTSSSGKSSFAQLIAYPCLICTADDYYYDEKGNYNFDASKLGEAHASCKAKFDEGVKDPVITNIVIANTNTKPFEYQYYVDKAEKYGMRVTYVVLERRHNNKNDHDVPDHVLERQENTIKQNLKLR
jgi:predicted kinase